MEWGKDKGKCWVRRVNGGGLLEGRGRSWREWVGEKEKCGGWGNGWYRWMWKGVRWW